MAQNVAIETLLNQRNSLVLEKNAAMSKFNEEISSIEAAIETLSGKKVWETISETVYDDENPNYIRSSQEEM